MSKTTIFAADRRRLRSWAWAEGGALFVMSSALGKQGVLDPVRQILISA
jgi:hypothetical protein